MVSTIKTTDKTKSVFDETQKALKELEEGKFDQDEAVFFLCKFWVESKGFDFSTQPGKILLQASELKKQIDKQHGSAAKNPSLDEATSKAAVKG